MKHILISTALILAVVMVPACAENLRQEIASPLKLKETINPLFNSDLPNVQGKSLIAIEVSFPPGTSSPPHHHPKSAFVYAYVLSGEVISAVNNEQPHLYRPGDSWHENPGAHHTVTRNASSTNPAKLLVIFVANRDERQLVTPDSK